MPLPCPGQPGKTSGVPLHVHIAPDQKSAVLTGTGEVAAAELVQAVRALYGDLDRTSRLRQVLYDYTAVRLFQVSADEVRAVTEVEWLAAQANPGLVLCIAASDLLLANLQRLWGRHAPFRNPWRVEVFPTRAAAEAWMRAQPDAP